MTLKQEAIELIQEQPNDNVRIIIDLLKKLSKKPEQKKKKNRKFGIGKDIINLPNDFFEHFDDDNEEIAAMFYGETL